MYLQSLERERKETKRDNFYNVREPQRKRKRWSLWNNRHTWKARSKKAGKK
jgi:hypothetical protein